MDTKGHMIWNFQKIDLLNHNSKIDISVFQKSKLNYIVHDVEACKKGMILYYAKTS